MITSLGELATFRGGSAFPRDEQGQRTGAIPFMKVSDLSRGTGKWKCNDAANWLSKGQIDSLRPTIAPASATVFAKIGEGLRSERCRLLTGPTAIDNNMMAAIPTARADAAYLYYLLHTVGLSTFAVGSALPYLKQSTLNQIRVEVPSLLDQQAIAEVLGALDDKIAANTKLASTADEWVRTEYARTGSASADTIPISELATHVRQTVNPDQVEPTAAYVGLEHVPRRSMWLSGYGTAESVTSAKVQFEAGDILFGKLRPYFHKVVAAPRDGICSTDILVLRPKHTELSGFVLATLSSDEVVREATASSEGTRMPRASWKDVSAIEVPWPGRAETVAFSEHVEILRSTIETLLRESRTLAATRDVLLPQLMSGKLQVKDAEAAVECLV